MHLEEALNVNFGFGVRRRPYFPFVGAEAVLRGMVAAARAAGRFKFKFKPEVARWERYAALLTNLLRGGQAWADAEKAKLADLNWRIVARKPNEENQNPRGEGK